LLTLDGVYAGEGIGSLLKYVRGASGQVREFGSGIKKASAVKINPLCSGPLA
jgi:hypothetical protein